MEGGDEVDEGQGDFKGKYRERWTRLGQEGVRAEVAEGGSVRGLEWHKVRVVRGGKNEARAIVQMRRVEQVR